MLTDDSWFIIIRGTIGRSFLKYRIVLLAKATLVFRQRRCQIVPWIMIENFEIVFVERRTSSLYKRKADVQCCLIQHQLSSYFNFSS
ncbi:MAG: hypothetical protein B6D34_11605 [Candidatus Brocadia sp. UTAMX1]|nr:MAG: hypothetical protein B6D34_11605 [Candidatus Brocadia sp. UTAMX1]